MGTAGLTDDELAARATDYRATKDIAERLAAQAKAIADELLAELARRKTTTIADVGGWKIARRSKTTTSYDVDKAKATLTDYLWRRIAPRTVSRDILAAQVAANLITASQLATFATAAESAPWVDVQPVKGAKP